MSSCAQETPLIVYPIDIVTSTITFAHESALIIRISRQLSELQKNLLILRLVRT